MTANDLNNDQTTPDAAEVDTAAAAPESDAAPADAVAAEPDANVDAPAAETSADETADASAADDAPAEQTPAAEAAADETPAGEAPADGSDDAGQPASDQTPVDAPAEEPAAAAAAASEQAETPADPSAAAGAAEQSSDAEQATAEQAATTPPAPATPSAVPTPGSFRPKAPAAPAKEWGKVDDEGTVSVLEGEAWRVVGQYPDGTPAEALAYFRRKFDELEFKVRNLEQRHRSGGAAASDLTGQARALLGEVEGAAAVGDLVGLAGRLTSLTSSLSAATAEEAQAAKEAQAAAVAERTEIVVAAEALAARDPKTIQWKQATEELNTLFAAWQTHQSDGPRLPRSTSQELWKRFRNARSVVERHRREFFAQLDETHKGARDAKAKLVEKAEALATKGEDGITAYRSLLDDWKRAGRAGRKADDALWARFKAAGDVLYGARTERDAAEQAESLPRIEARQALLEEAKAVAAESDLRKARQILTGIQRNWDEVGRIFPRDKERQLDDEMRRIEQALRSREDVDWKKNNPETQARADGMTRQLLDAIEKLEADVAAAEAKGDAKAAAAARESLEARQAWLKALGS